MPLDMVDRVGADAVRDDAVAAARLAAALAYDLFVALVVAGADVDAIDDPVIAIKLDAAIEEGDGARIAGADVEVVDDPVFAIKFDAAFRLSNAALVSMLTSASSLISPRASNRFVVADSEVTEPLLLPPPLFPRLRVLISTFEL